ncbi:MAG: membrane dipeptidase [Burkholderiales bacterium]|nr:membrane dipeptidase [Burkholderiales bacterium]
MTAKHDSEKSDVSGFHRDALVIDGLTPLYVLDEPYTEALVAGGVDAGFLSIASPQPWDEVLRRTETALTKIEKNPVLMLATKAEDIRRAKEQRKIALVLITQAADMLEKDLSRVGILYRLGFRVLGVCYTFANLLGCGCGELRDGGLTFLGKDFVAAVNEFPLMLDVSHAGHQTSLDAVQLARAPVVTHGNAYAITSNDRNKKDEVLRIVAEKGGVIGLNALPCTVSPKAPSLDHMLQHVDYITGKFGLHSMGLGLDYVEGFKREGKVLPQSVRNRTLRPDIFGSVNDFLNQDYAKNLEKIEKLPNLTKGLLAKGYSEDAVRGILGENWLRAFERFAG